MASVTIPKDDVGFKLEFTVKDSDENVVDLTAYDNVYIKMWVDGVPATLLLNKPCTNLAADGTCDYTIALADFTDATYPSVGTYQAELELQSTGVVESTRNFQITIEESG